MQIARPVLYALYQVTQEAIDHAFRHASAGQITVGVHYGVDNLRVSVADDGVGLGGARPSSERRPGHAGLRGSRERIERVGGELVVRTGPRAGTEVRRSVPAAVAYETPPIGGLRALLRWRARPRTRSEDSAP